VLQDLARHPVQIAVDATTWNNDRGYGRFTRELVRGLVARGTHRYTLLTDAPLVPAAPRECEVVVAEVGRTTAAATSGTRARSIRDLLRLGARLSSLPADLVFFPAVYSYYPYRKRGPCVVCLHDATAEEFGKLVFPTWRNRMLWAVKTRLAIGQATRVMTVSQASARQIQQFLKVPAEHMDVVSEGVDSRFQRVLDADRVRARWQIPAEAPLLLHVGGLNPHKNLMRLLDAMAAVLEQVPEARLMLVGDVSGQGFHDTVQTLRSRADGDARLRARVVFPGRLGDEDLVLLYNTAQAFVFPSLSEGFGLPALEAMACGCPVVGSRRTSIPEVVGDAGMFFDPMDTADMARTLLAFLAEPARQAELRKKAVLRARQFTWDRAAQLAEECFARAAKK
jgi:glycosyltransferase involved in cell wall biosynthesis